MNKEWLIYEKFYNKELCENLISEIQSLPTLDGVVGTENGFVISDSRKSKIRFIDKDNKKYSWIFRDLWAILGEANKTYNYDIDTLNFVQVAEYDGKNAGEYREHLDCIWDADKHRKLSCTIQLSDRDSYVGGELHFYRLQGSYPNKQEIFKMGQQGSLIFFNSLTYHSILPVYEGKRYSLTAWFEGPRWR